MSYPNNKSRSGEADGTIIIADVLQGRRVSAEQHKAGGYREANRIHLLPTEFVVEAEGSWLNSKHNPKNG